MIHEFRCGPRVRQVFPDLLCVFFVVCLFWSARLGEGGGSGCQKKRTGKQAQDRAAGAQRGPWNLEARLDEFHSNQPTTILRTNSNDVNDTSSPSSSRLWFADGDTSSRC